MTDPRITKLAEAAKRAAEEYGHARCLNNEFDNESSVKRAGARLYAAIDALALAAQGAPEGWKLVPIEPTEAIELAGEKALVDEFFKASRKPWADVCGHVYRAMVAASMTKPSEDLTCVPWNELRARQRKEDMRAMLPDAPLPAQPKDAP